MAKINLLPWRQELRNQRKQEFVAINLAVVAIAAGLVLFGNTLLAKQVSDQEEINLMIKADISKLDGEIKEIDELQKRRDELLARMKVIQDLQGHRPIIVRVFDEMVRALPDGVYLQSLDRVGNTFKIKGVAETTNQISNFMRNLESSQWFAQASLSTVVAEKASTAATDTKAKAAQAAEVKGSQFEVTVALEAPSADTEQASADNKKEGGK